MNNPAPGDTGSRGWGPPFPAERLSNSVMLHDSPPMFVTFLSHITNSVVKKRKQNKLFSDRLIRITYCASMSILEILCPLFTGWLMHRRRNNTHIHTLVTHWSSVTGCGNMKSKINFRAPIRQTHALSGVNVEITKPWRSVPYCKCRINHYQVRRWHISCTTTETLTPVLNTNLRLNMLK